MQRTDQAIKRRTGLLRDLLHHPDQIVYLLRLALNAETDPYESGQNAAREPGVKDQSQIGSPGAEWMDAKQVLDEQMCAETSAPHADAAVFREFFSYQIVRHVL